MDEWDARADSRVVLLDNGSVNPDSVLAGRKLAASFSEQIGQPVDLVSVAHSDRIPAEDLEGIPAEIWEIYLVIPLIQESESCGSCPSFSGLASPCVKPRKQPLH